MSSGVRFNLPSYDPGALSRPEASILLDRLQALGLFAQVHANDAQWAEIAPNLRASRVAGPGRPLRRPRPRGRRGSARVPGRPRARTRRPGDRQLSAPFRLSSRPDGYGDLDAFVEALLGAFGPGACVFGSDWPFLGLRTRPDLGRVLKALGRWLPDRRDRQRVLWDNPFRLFGFGEARP